MKTFALLFAISAFAMEAQSRPHLDLEMSSNEYRKILLKESLTEERVELPIKIAISLGDRLSKWISTVNALRTPEGAIRLTSPDSRRVIPIDSPHVYSPSIIRIETEKILEEMPTSMKSVLLGKGALPTQVGMEDEVFIIHARKVDRNYQSAARYKLVERHRDSYVTAANFDVRGYYYLKQNKITEFELRDLSTIPKGQVPLIRNSLYKICLNAIGDTTLCGTRVSRAFSRNTLASFYTKHIEAAERNWKRFFEIPTSEIRKDVYWSSSSMTVPFNTPTIQRFVPYLKNNIQEEFRWKGWELKLNLGTFSNGPRLLFEAGVVPHVTGENNNLIVMDSNQPIEEYESQWIIRHEFGHVLGLPDCYHEFYDEKEKAYVNYQLDTTDLMCSRAGNMNERIFLELKKAYQK